MNLNTILQLLISFKKNKHVYLHPYRDVNIYMPEMNLIYIGISKTGISSIKSLFLKKYGEPYDEKEYDTIHVKGSKVFKYIPKKKIVNKESFKFSFVRNPFDRLVSCYKNKIMDKNENYKFIQNAYGDMFYEGMPFDKFIKSVCKIPDLLSDRHFRSQYSYLFYKNKLIVDFLGKFENIENDFKVIQKKYNLDELPHINKSESTKSYHDYYTSELVELVYDRYRHDIQTFNYIKELNELRNHVDKNE